MATRADFYVKKETPQYLGSIAFDGYSIGEKIDIKNFSPNDIESRKEDYLEYLIRNCTDSTEYVSLVVEFLNKRRDGSLVEKHGFPFPWDTSKLTDCVYLFDIDKSMLFKKCGYDGDHDDHTTPCYFIPVDVENYDLDGNELDVEKTKYFLPNVKELYKSAIGTERDSIMIFSF